MNSVLFFFIVVLGLPLIFCLYLIVSVYKPKPEERVEVVRKGKASAPVFSGKVKVLSWNIQFCAGVHKIFFYDRLDSEKKELMMVEVGQVEKILPQILAVIKTEKPDVVLLQEVDAGSRRVQYRDQVEPITQALSAMYPYSCSAYYINAPWEPNLYVRGAFKMKLLTLSRYPITDAKRLALPVLPVVWIDRIFRLQRCVLSAEIRLSKDQSLRVMNTHLEAFSKGSDVLQKEVQRITEWLTRWSKEKRHWTIGGDFNLLATKEAREALPLDQQHLYNPKTELATLLKAFQCSPSLQQLKGKSQKSFFSYAPNHPEKRTLDRTLDYLFSSDTLVVDSCKVLQKEGRDISDHMPLVVEYQLGGK